MVNRIFWSAAITLALTFSPNLALAVPTKTTKKKSSKPPEKVAKKSKSVQSSRTSRTSSSRNRSQEVVESSMVSGYSGRGTVTETPPLMKVTPQRDGKFMLEPLTPKKILNTPLSKPPKQEDVSDRRSSNPPKYNTSEPWNFSELILTQAKAYQNAPYARGASLKNGSATDCSGFVQFIYHGFKIDLPRSSAEQAQVGKVVTRQMDFSKMLPGDLLFFRRGGRSVGHAGIYLGEGKMIHASNHRYGVVITDLRQPYYEGTLEVAKRVFEVKYPN
ncbi:MAG: NlpC/P60 family protein [Deltaproteobacteria bacterium]|nr:NlpC/P60 family protein [Deltaproteobacteria bacterium]